MTLTVPLSEEAVIEDLRYMSSEMAKMTKKYDVNAPNVVVVLPGNRLIINDLFIEPGVSCVLKNNMETFIGQIVSVDSKVPFNPVVLYSKIVNAMLKLPLNSSLILTPHPAPT